MTRESGLLFGPPCIKTVNDFNSILYIDLACTNVFLIN